MLPQGGGPHHVPCVTDELGLEVDPFLQILFGKVGGRSAIASPRTLTTVEQATSLCGGGRTTDTWQELLGKAFGGT